MTKQIYLFVLPLAATVILQQMFNVADTAVVGRFVGTQAMAAVGTNGSIVQLIVNTFNGIAMGSTVCIANAIGRCNKEETESAVRTSVSLAVIGGFVMLLIGELLVPSMMRLIKVPDDVLSMATLYLRVYLLGLPVIFLYNFEAAIFRAAGDTGTPLKALSISGVLNVALNVFFVVVLKMTVEGVALATVLSNLVSAAILFRALLVTESDIRLHPKKILIDKTVLGRILEIGLPSGLQGAMFAISNITIQSAVNTLGSTVMAASSAGFNLEVIAYFTMTSFGHSSTTFTGQNYGANKLDRCRKAFGLNILHAYICTGIMCAVILGFSRQLLSIFNSEPMVIYYGQIRLQIIFFSFIFSIWQEVGSGYLRGFGKSLFPAVTAIIGICGTRIIWIATVFKHSQTFATIMIAYPVSLFLTGVIILGYIFVTRPSKKITR